MAITLDNIVSNINTLSNALDKNVFIKNARESFKTGINEYEISNEEKAKLIATYEAQVSVGIVGQVMSMVKELPEIIARESLIQSQKTVSEAQEIAEKIKNGEVYYIYTYYESTDVEVVAGTKAVGDIKTKTLATGTTKSIYELQAELTQKQIDGFDKDMFYKVLGKAGESLQMLSVAGATSGYAWLGDTMKLSIEAMTDGKINLQKVSGDDTTTTEVETSHTTVTYSETETTPSLTS